MTTGMPSHELFRSVVITGVSGLVGSALAEVLTARKIPFIPLRRSDCDITNPHSVNGMFEKHAPTLLINCAAHARVDAAEQESVLANSINGEGPGLLAAGAKQRGAFLVHFSSNYVFAGQ